mgnify:CR=1 FL=1
MTHKTFHLQVCLTYKLHMITYLDHHLLGFPGVWPDHHDAPVLRPLDDGALELLGGGGGSEGSEGLLGFQEFHGDLSGVAHSLLGLPAHSNGADGVLSDGFPDDDITDIITASNVVGGRDVL